MSSMTQFVSSLQSLNPVLDRELRQRSRSGRSIAILSSFLLMALGLLYLIYLGESTADNFRGGLAQLDQTRGRTMFEWVVVLELVIMSVVVPALGSTAISGERDRQTLVPLQVTLVSPLSIYLGKVGASSAFVGLIVFSTAPLLAICYLVGGISFLNVLTTTVALMVVGFYLAAIGVAWSAIVTRTVAATMVSYGFILIMSLLPLVLLIPAALIISETDVTQEAWQWFALPVYLNPFAAIAGAGGDVAATNLMSGEALPMSGAKSALVASDTTETNLQNYPPDVRWIPIWIRSLIAQGIVVLGLSYWAVRRLRTPTDTLKL